MKIVDSHCDTLLRCYNEGISFFDEKSPLQLDYSKIIESNIVLQYFALFIESKYKPFTALEQALKLINYFKQSILSDNRFRAVLSKDDLKYIEKKHLAILALEGGEPLGSSLELLEIFFALGIRSIGLTWNERNAIGNGCLDSDLGLSRFGKDLVNKMQDMGVIVDCAHLSDQGLGDVLEIASGPILISHANCSALYKHPRNISDYRLKQLAQNGGLIGITFVPQFLSTKSAGIDDIVKHIYHAIKVAGIDHVALGSDFDGVDNLPKGITGAESFYLIADKLMEAGLNNSEIDKITFKNHVRFLKQVLK